VEGAETEERARPIEEGRSAGGRGVIPVLSMGSCSPTRDRGNGRQNRITLCAWHHLRGIHAGRVRAEGDAPDAFTWEIGVRPRQRPLLRLIGEQYAGGAV
jgi:hypothetical protein